MCAGRGDYGEAKAWDSEDGSADRKIPQPDDWGKRLTTEVKHSANSIK